MGLFAIIWAIIVGFIVGAIARFLMPGIDAMGFWLTAVLGIGGSIVGGIIAAVLFRSPGGGFRPAGFILSVIGAIILLWLYRHYVMV
ncbi:MAG TPA: GlsB/YeaQ/YmgE family stress response membrane protein [Casimicrobiaceae bacterium]|nr:GlsB/YeaQ/YmgE family stress response membrane protein [Casimicrobiaceae bacterium]